MSADAPAWDQPPRPFLAARMLAWREVIRFFRQRNRIVGAIGQPILFWLLFSAGMNRAFDVPGQSFGQYYLPGTLLLILLFTAIFATISIIEDRKEGFLQSVLVAPIPRWAMVLGKVVGGATTALLQGLIFLALTLTMGVDYSLGAVVGIVVLMALIALSLTCLGFVIAWRLDSTQGFHAIMNLLLMPMWLLSGAFFPVPAVTAEGTWGERLLYGVMWANPVTYAVAGLRHLMVPAEPLQSAARFWIPAPAVSWLVTIAFTLVMFAAAWWIARRNTAGDMQ